MTNLHHAKPLIKKGLGVSRSRKHVRSLDLKNRSLDLSVDYGPEINLANAHKHERYAVISPQNLENDPMLDQFLSSFACTMEWRRSMKA